MKLSILIPTDFSENAWSAIAYTLKLYSNQSCTIYFLHAWSVTPSDTRTYITSNYIDRLKEDAEKQLVGLKNKAKNTFENPNHIFQTIFSTKKLQDAIDIAIKKHDINLISMGTKGATKSIKIFFGSNTVNIIKKTKLCPMLVVPDKFEFTEPKQVAFPTDFNRFYGDELQPLKDITKLYNSKIRVVHICKEENLTEAQNYNLAMLKAYLEDYPHSFHWQSNDAKKTEGINDFIQKHDINILALINYEHSFIENLVNEPIIKKIGSYPTIPLLIIPCLR